VTYLRLMQRDEKLRRAIIALGSQAQIRRILKQD
jgi:hypothetical protein